MEKVKNSNFKMSARVLLNKRQVIEVMLIVLFLFILEPVNGELSEYKCKETKECYDFMYYFATPNCYNSGASVSSEKCNEIIQEKYPENYSKFKKCLYLLHLYAKEYSEGCSYIDNLQNNISGEECKKSLKEAEEYKKSFPDRNYLVEYKWAGKVCGKMGMCNYSYYEAYKKVIDLMQDPADAKKWYLESIKCYDIWYGDLNQIKKIYKDFADTTYNFGLYPRFKYEDAANLYILAEDYENACKSCQEANRYYLEANKDITDKIPLLNCEKYGCENNETSKMVRKSSDQPTELDYDLILTVAIISTTILLTAFVIWYKKFKQPKT